MAMMPAFCAHPPSMKYFWKLLPTNGRCLHRSLLASLSASSFTSSPCLIPRHTHLPTAKSCYLSTLVSSRETRIPHSIALRKSLSTSPALSAASEELDTFFAAEGTTWESLGLADDVLNALQRAQLHRPSAVQATAIPPILHGGDVIIAAETGSGKTQAYLAPLLTKLLKKNQEKDNTATQSNEVRRSEAQHFVLILCPNAMLCEQVAEMANVLRDSAGVPLLKTSVVSGGQGWPISPPDIVVATPAALLNHLFAYDPRRRRRNAFVRDVKYVVFDEADMLLSGSFENQVIRLLNMFRLEEKQVSKTQSSMTESENTDYRPWTDFEPAEPIEDDGHETEDKEESKLSEDEDTAATLSDSEDEEKITSKSTRHKDWLRSRKVYTRSKQYIFAAATLPENGRKTPGAVLKRLFPDAKWVNGLFLHRQNPRLQEYWAEVDGTTQVQTLLDAVSRLTSSDSDNLPRKTLVFANSVESADAICRILQRADIDCLCYHRQIIAEERTRNLKVFEEEGGVLVCTDAAARGLDIHNIVHVIQAEFAKTAVDYLHRVGRTARAGQSGIVTSLYTKANRPLVEAVRKAEAAGLPVEGAFSRKRSFRNKLKKAGMISQMEE